MRSSMIPPSGGADHRVVGAPDGERRRVGDDARAARAAPASGPSTNSSPMCDRSNRPARSRTARCSSRIPAYWTGISQPANSISRAPRAAVAIARAGSRGRPGRRPRRSPAPSRPGAAAGLARAGGRSASRAPAARRHERALGLEGQDRRRLVEVDPADLRRTRGRARRGRRRSAPSGSSGRSCGCASPRLDEPVLDRVERPGDPDLEPGLLGDLAEGGLLASSRRRSGVPFGQRPGADRRARAGGCRRRADGRPAS